VSHHPNSFRLLQLIVSFLCKVDAQLFITFFKRGPADPSQQCKTASNSIQDPPPRWILTIFKLKFGGGNLFSTGMTSTIEGNNFVWSLLKLLLKKVTPVVGSRMLCLVYIIHQFRKSLYLGWLEGALVLLWKGNWNWYSEELIVLSASLLAETDAETSSSMRVRIFQVLVASRARYINASP
jgi:hypothetical protein